MKFGEPKMEGEGLDQGQGVENRERSCGCQSIGHHGGLLCNRDPQPNSNLCSYCGSGHDFRLL